MADLLNNMSISLYDFSIYLLLWTAKPQAPEKVSFPRWKKVLLQDLRVMNSPDLYFLALGYFCSVLTLNHNAISFCKYLFVRYTVDVINRIVLVYLSFSLNLHLIRLNFKPAIEFLLHKLIYKVIVCSFL